MCYLLFPLAGIYWLLVYIRNKFYDFGILPSSYGSIPTIVLGNITVGGTGKTPFTIYLANLLKKITKIAVLSRGYKRKKKGCFLIKSSDSYLDVGDEPKLIYESTAVPLAVCSDRIKGIKLIKNLLSETKLVILDDGFQHRRLKPNLSIVLIDWNRPVQKDFFLPVGSLRDNLYRLKTADIIVFTKCPEDLNKIEAFSVAKKINIQHKDIFFTTYNLLNPYNFFTKESIPLESLKTYKVLGFSGLANNIFFETKLRQISDVVKFIEFSDHHKYTKKDLKKIFSNFAKIHTNQKLILTTEKDLVKLLPLGLTQFQRQYIYTLPIKIKFLFGQEQIFNKKIYDYGRKLISKD